MQYKMKYNKRDGEKRVEEKKKVQRARTVIKTDANCLVCYFNWQCVSHYCDYSVSF